VTVVYVDSVFVLNTCMDYLLLLATGRLSGVPLHRRRYLAAAVLGGAYAVAVFLPGCGLLVRWPVKLAFGMALSAVAFGGGRAYPRMTLLLFAVSCGMAGCVLGLGLLAGGVPMENGVFYTNVDGKVLLTAAAAAYLTFTVVFRASAKNHVRGTLLPFTIGLNGRQMTLKALCDTGNALQDPATGRPLLVVSASHLRELWPPELRLLVSSAALKDPAAAMERLHSCGAPVCFRLVPYSAVGVSGGLLLAFRSDWTRIGGRTYDKLLVALSPTELGGSFSALWGGTEGGNTHVEVVGAPARAAEAAVSAGAGPLHRRE